MSDEQNQQGLGAVSGAVAGNNPGPGNANLPQAPSVEEKLEKQNAENLEKAVAGGYKPAPEPTIEERKAALIKDMEHAVQHNAPITIAMLTEMRALLGVEG